MPGNQHLNVSTTSTVTCLYVSVCFRQQKVDVTITTMRSGVVRVEDSEESLYASIDLVSDKIARKLKKVIRAVL
jgi:ribosomal subunit interface protein